MTLETDQKISNKHIPDRFYDLLSKHFTILETIHFLQFDKDYDILREKLSNLKKQTFAPNEKIIIEHCETDYYNRNILKHGLYLYNFFSIVKSIDIPLSVFVIFTSHFGIEEEINEILIDHPEDDRPLIFETFIEKPVYDSSPNAYKDIDINIDKIKYQGLSMMGAPRSHRFALYNYLVKNNLLDKIKVSIRAQEK
jgi:hypothetical protein